MRHESLKQKGLRSGLWKGSEDHVDTDNEGRGGSAEAGHGIQGGWEGPPQQAAYAGADRIEPAGSACDVERGQESGCGTWQFAVPTIFYR